MTKPKCLGIFFSNKSWRRYGVARVNEFAKRFPLRGFLLQAPQVAADWTGYGLTLGSYMSFLTDLFWVTVRAPWHGAPKFRGPPPSDPWGKALNFLGVPGYHRAFAGALSYEDHWLLTAADVVATTLLMERYPASILADRVEVISQTPVIEFEPWNPATLQVLSEYGWTPDMPRGYPLAGLPERATYGQVCEAIGAGLPAWSAAVRLDFPASTSATYFTVVESDAGRDVLRWLNGGVEAVDPIFEPEEFVMARCFEYGIFPPFDVPLDLLDWFVQRALEISRAVGRDLPGRAEMILAANEVWGGYSTTS